MCNPKVSSRHGFLNSGFVKLRKLFLNFNHDRPSDFALSLSAISAKFPRSPIFLGTKYGAKCYPQHKYWWAGRNMAACSPVCEFTINVLRMCGKCECGKVRFSRRAGTGIPYVGSKAFKPPVRSIYPLERTVSTEIRSSNVSANFLRIFATWTSNFRSP